ncbi:MAG: 2-oxoacid:ferredoxin oxidoreductase subunit beta [Candidatus Helarchaeota archaeon]|nr:2-oxoacid:ferredoxin oxidoreductase subunit beta [Candidatus Helarchaeota archaeon]
MDNPSLIKKYIRLTETTFCSGCGNGIILNCFIRAVENLKLEAKSILCVSGIGCSSWIPSPYLKLDTFHTLHGRAIAFATGAKVFNKTLNVVVFTGDGDGAGIGGNHLIHAARRNIAMTVLLVNNSIYGMTGGQYAPTTPVGAYSSTSIYGNPEEPFDLCKLVEAAGATYVARWTTNYPRKLIKSIEEALSNNGFSFIEILTQCPTEFGRKNKLDSPVEYFKYLNDITTMKKEQGKIQLGIFVKEIKPEFTQKLDLLIENSK